MKYKSKDFSKFAWPSRLTAPIIKVELVIQCKRLPKKDLLSQADAFCVLWRVPNGYTPPMIKGMPSNLPGRQEDEINRTETQNGVANPTFKTKFPLDFTFNEEQTYILRVYSEDLNMITDLNEHHYLGGCIFTLGQLLGAKGRTILKRLGRDKSFLVITGDEIVDTREVLEFRFSCQDLIKQQSLLDQSKVLDKSNPYFQVEKLRKDDQSWEVVWKSEVVKDSLSPTWKVARLPLQLLCNGFRRDPVKVTIWDYEKHSTQHDHMGYVESTVNELVEKAKAKIDGIPVFQVMRERRKWFGGSKPKPVGLMKVLKANVLTIPSMLEHLSGGCSLDLMIGIDCSINNGTGVQGLHHSASHWLNDYQAGIQKFGSIMENFARGRHSSMWGFGGKVDGEDQDVFMMADRLVEAREMLQTYDSSIAKNKKFALGETGVRLKPLIEATTFRAIRSCKNRQSYTILCVFTTGSITDLQESIDLICAAAEDAPLSIVIIGVGNRDFSAIERACTNEKGPMRDSRNVPIARDIVHFVSFKRFAGNASEVVADGLKDIPEQFVQYFVTNGTKPNPVIPPPDLNRKPRSSSPKKTPKQHKKDKAKAAAREAKNRRRALLRDTSTYL